MNMSDSSGPDGARGALPDDRDTYLPARAEVRATSTTTAARPAPPTAPRRARNRPGPRGRARSAHELDRRTVAILVTAETLLAALLGIWRLGHNSMWADEAYTWSTAARGWSSFVSVVIRHEGGGVLHALLMFFWVRLGTSPTFLRAPSVVFAALTVPFAYHVGRRLFGQRVGLAAGLLLALNANVLFYAQEARTYALTVLLATAAFAFFVDDVEEPSPGRFAGWVACSALAVYTLPLAGAITVAQAVSLLFAPREELRVRRLVRGFVLIVVCVVPMAVIQLIQASSGKVNAYLEGARTPGVILKLVLGLSGGGGPALIAAYALLVGTAAWVGWQTWRAAPRSWDTWRIAVPFCWVVVSVVLVVASSYVTPNFASRYFLMSVPGVALLGAFGLCTLTRRSTRLLVVGLVVMVPFASLGLHRYYFEYHSDDFRDATAYVFTHDRTGDAVVFIGDEARMPFEYYVRDQPVQRRMLQPAWPSQPWGHFGTGDTHETMPSAARTADISRRYGRIWLFLRYDPNSKESGRRIAQLAQGRSVRHWTFQNTVKLYLFVPES